MPEQISPMILDGDCHQGGHNGVSSYADVAASGPKQSPEDAAAPQPPQIIPNESVTTSTSSLVDVDSQSVRTVPSDFLEQSVQTDTQQARLEREHEEQTARDKARQKKEAAKKKAARADNWILSRLAALSDGQANALAAANVALVVGLSGVLGYKAWGLHERGQFSWKTAGIGAGIVGVVGVFEGVFGRYFTKAR
ncbi:putative mitochondrial intermembrane space import and assembly protein 40 [Diaporthe ampelina]|uniref:Putative mitochondrial intermembrane space import and assembly protein 40 n=1 Tax=Diaporthe ampelina TaxID=1214573 RepID=A0A0G2I6V1_9PEZI|nr:putative mitochondrial intermembrane space import and assembly protein 40 [Diaporthe ampelina]